MLKYLAFLLAFSPALIVVWFGWWFRGAPARRLLLVVTLGLVLLGLYTVVIDPVQQLTFRLLVTTQAELEARAGGAWMATVVVSALLVWLIGWPIGQRLFRVFSRAMPADRGLPATSEHHGPRTGAPA